MYPWGCVHPRSCEWACILTYDCMHACVHACMCVYACIYATFPILSIKFFNSCVNCNSCYFYWLIALLVTKCVLPYHCDLYSECDSYTYVYPYNFPFLWYTSNISTCKCILWSIKCAQACGNSVIMHVHSTWQAHKTKLTWNLPIESFTNINFPYTYVLQLTFLFANLLTVNSSIIFSFSYPTLLIRLVFLPFQLIQCSKSTVVSLTQWQPTWH